MSTTGMEEETVASSPQSSGPGRIASHGGQVESHENLRDNAASENDDLEAGYSVLEESHRNDTVLFEASSFNSVEAMFEARASHSTSKPALFRVSREWLASTLKRINDSDEVCLDDTPPELVERYLKRIGRPRCDAGTGLLTLPGLVSHVESLRPTAFLLANADRFKALNDEFGHRIADQVLREIAKRLVDASSENALVARIGGDTFGIALFGTKEEAQTTAEAIRKAWSKPIAGIGQLTVSIGYVSIEEGQALSFEEMQRRADQALYAAKARGRNCAISYQDLVREAEERDTDPQLESFANVTRVLADRIAETISRKGRRLFGTIRAEADIDAITGLFCRRYLDRRLPWEIEQALSGHSPIVVALLDIDFFGLVNKEHGWPTGDRVLAEAAERIRSSLRQTDWAARYGGEEFCTVLSSINIEAAKQVLERVRRTIASTPFRSTSGTSFTMTVSIGAAELQSGDSAAGLVERASGRLMAAKRQGRNCVRI